MRLNFFSRDEQFEQRSQPGTSDQLRTGRTFPADEVAWGIAIRNGFDELDDPWYHRGLTQHAYLEGNDNVAICGYRPPQSGPRTRRRSRLGMPTTGQHPMCGMCARMVVAPRPRVPIAVQPARPPVAIPVRPDPGMAPAPVGVAPRAAISGAAVAAPSNGIPPPTPGMATTAEPQTLPPAPPTQQTDELTSASVTAWARRVESEGLDPEQAAGSGLLDRGVHTEFEDE